eukprot:SAG31_NODE_294_length_18242_cov_28.418949_21_plen_96_part_00
MYLCLVPVPAVFLPLRYPSNATRDGRQQPNLFRRVGNPPADVESNFFRHRRLPTCCAGRPGVAVRDAGFLKTQLSRLEKVIHRCKLHFLYRKCRF